MSWGPSEETATVQYIIQDRLKIKDGQWHDWLALPPSHSLDEVLESFQIHKDELSAFYETRLIKRTITRVDVPVDGCYPKEPKRKNATRRPKTLAPGNKHRAKGFH